MSHFYGVVRGQARSEGTRRGSKSSGMKVVAASWDGAVETRVWHDDASGKDMFEVVQRDWHGSGVSRVVGAGVMGK